jgi:shikimate kinase
MNNVILCGFMGCGKSTVGKNLARKTGRRFVDMDRYIEEKEGMTVSEIFERYGEAGFRRAETGALAEMTRLQPGIISPGGGAAMNPVNAKIMRNYGSIILLDRPLERILEDLRPEKRPLLKDDPENRLRALYEERMPVYRALADATVRNDGDLQTAVTMIVRVLRERYHA